MKNDDVSHDGHRKRLLDLVVNAGIDNMSDIQIVEYMLTYIFPRGDVNPLSHRLLDTYGNLTNIIDASSTDLMTVKGINERSAKKISMLGELFYAYSTAKLRKKCKVDCKADVLDIVEDVLRDVVVKLREHPVVHEFAFIWRRGSIYAEWYRELFRRFSA